MNKTNDYSVSYIAEAPNHPDISSIVIHSSISVGELKKILRHVDDSIIFREIVLNSKELEQRRYEAATAAMQGMIAGGYQWEAEEIARMAVKYADALIEELRKPLT